MEEINQKIRKVLEEDLGLLHFSDRENPNRKIFFSSDTSNEQFSHLMISHATASRSRIFIDIFDNTDFVEPSAQIKFWGLIAKKVEFAPNCEERTKTLTYSILGRILSD